MDISVKIGTSVDRKNIIISNLKTPKDAMQQANIPYGTAQVHLDGVPLTVEQMNKSFDSMGVQTDCMLIAVAKTINA